MSSEKQVAANRRNAQLSTGPKTPEGKDAVRLNALKHGLTAQDAVIFPEDDEAFYELRNNFLDQLQPAGPLETALAHQIVMAQWRLARIRRLETGLFGLGHVDNEEDMNQDYTSLPPRSRLAYVFQRNSEVLSTLSRYEARIERAFYRALHELQRLQADRQPPDPPPPSKTNSAEQTQSGPEPAPNPMAPNDLPLLVGQESPPARDFTGSLLDAAGHARPWQVPRGHAQELHYLSIE